MDPTFLLLLLERAVHVRALPDYVYFLIILFIRIIILFIRSIILFVRIIRIFIFHHKYGNVGAGGGGKSAAAVLRMKEGLSLLR